MSAKSIIGGGNKSAKITQKLNEVKEVIQNKPDADIVKVLEYLNYDVGETINSFVNDDGKEALAKWAENKSKKSQQQSTNDQQTNESAKNDGKENNKSNNNKQNKKQSLSQQNNTSNNNNNSSINNNPSTTTKSNKAFNINDLVASVINQYTSSNPPQHPPILTATPTPTILIDTNHNNPPTAATTTTTTATTTATITLPTGNGEQTTNIAGYKVTLFNNSSNGGTSTNVSTQSSSLNGRPSLLDLNDKQQQQQQLQPVQQQQQQLHIPHRTFNTAYVNPNARAVLEKHLKDLQRQTVQLNKISVSFNEEHVRSKLHLKQTFQQLRNLIDEREALLEKQLAASVQTGSHLLKERQYKAADLKLQADNAQHLSEQELLELKANMKHFVSERQLDEEFSSLKLVTNLNGDNEHLLASLSESINKLGSVCSIKNNYSRERPPKDLLLTPQTPQPPTNYHKLNGNHQPPSHQQPQPQPHQVQPTTVNSNNLAILNNGTTLNTKNADNKIKNNVLNGENKTLNGAGAKNNNNNTNTNLNNGNTHFDHEKDEGEFIEVKKPQRNKFKQQQLQQQQQPQPVNGNSYHTNNGNSKQSMPNGTAPVKTPKTASTTNTQNGAAGGYNKRNGKPNNDYNNRSNNNNNYASQNNDSRTNASVY